MDWNSHFFPFSFFLFFFLQSSVQSAWLLVQRRSMSLCHKLFDIQSRFSSSCSDHMLSSQHKTARFCHRNGFINLSVSSLCWQPRWKYATRQILWHVYVLSTFIPCVFFQFHKIWILRVVACVSSLKWWRAILILYSKQPYVEMCISITPMILEF